MENGLELKVFFWEMQKVETRYRRVSREDEERDKNLIAGECAAA